MQRAQRPMRDRVLIIVHNYALAHNRVRMELNAIADAGMSADVLCLRGTGEAKTETYRSARIRRLPVRRHRGAPLVVYVLEYLSFFLLAAVWASALVLRHRHRMVIVHSLPDVLVFSALVPRLMGTRVVLNLREFTPELIRTRYGVGDDHMLVRFSRFLERTSCRFAHLVITVHDTGADLLASRSTTRDKLVVITNSIDLAADASSPVGALHAAEGLTLLYHGTAGNEYDLLTVVDALAILANHRAGGKVCLRIVGDGPALPAVRAHVARRGVEELVRFEAPVPFEQVPKLLRDAHVGVPLLRETPYADLGIPTKLLECIAVGLPVISVPGRAIRGYFSVDSLLYVPFGDAEAVADAIELVLTDPALGAERAHRARMELEAISPDVMRARYAEILAA